MTTTKPAPRLGRHNAAEIAERVERERQRRIPPGEQAPLEVKDIAERVGLDHERWYKRARKRTPFTVEELGRVADVLGAPPLWPFLEWEVAAAIFEAAAERARLLGVAK
jgi:hypothetical protein